MDCTIYEVKTKALISCAFNAQLIHAFVFAYAKSTFSHVMDHLLSFHLLQNICPNSTVCCAKEDRHSGEDWSCRVWYLLQSTC